MSLTEGGTQSLQDLWQITGRPSGTIGSWCEGVPMQQVEFIFTLLERLPQTLRHQLVDQACRIYPVLSHPFLAHDPLAVFRLENIIRQSSGLTILRGGQSQELPRAFVLSAIGNSIRQVRLGKVTVLGLDTQSLPWASPRGITNTNHCREAHLLKQRISQIKEAAEGSLVLLGGDWSEMSGLGVEVGRLAARCNVIATESPAFGPNNPVRPRPSSMQVITVARLREQPEWIQISFQGSVS